ncbi:MAG: hypothetical protein K2Z81_00025, partial [Cyanobacteria bacterium]|nr:hypothetical protein [Cyanobacteriota bacterium]
QAAPPSDPTAARANFNLQLQTSYTTDTANPNPDGPLTTIPVRQTEGSVIPNPALESTTPVPPTDATTPAVPLTDAPTVSPNAPPPKSNREVNFAAPTVQGYNPMNPPGIAELKTGQQTGAQTADDPSRGQQAAIDSNFDITKRISNQSNYDANGITFDYNGTIASADGRQTGFHAQEMTDTKGRITGRTVEYNQPVDIRFQTQNGGSREVTGVTSIETKFNPATGNYDSVIRTSNGQQLTASTDTTGQVTFSDQAPATTGTPRAEVTAPRVGEVTTAADGSTERGFNGGAGRGILTVKADAQGKVVSVTDAQGKALEGQFELTANNGLRQTTADQVTTYNADGSLERRFTNPKSGEYTIRADAQGQVTEVLDKEGKPYQPKDASGKPVRFQLTDDGFKEITDNQETTRNANGSTSRVIKGEKGVNLYQIDTDANGASILTSNYERFLGMGGVYSTVKPEGVLNNLMIGNLQAGPNGDLSFVSSAVWSSNDRVTIHADGTTTTEVKNRDGSVVPITEGNVGNDRRVLSATFPPGHPMAGTWTRDGSNPEQWTNGQGGTFQGDIAVTEPLSGTYSITRTNGDNRTVDSFSRSGATKHEEFVGKDSTVSTQSKETNRDGSSVERTQLSQEERDQLAKQANDDSLKDKKIERVTITDTNGQQRTVYQVDLGNSQTYTVRAEDASGSWVRRGGQASHDWAKVNEDGSVNEQVKFKGDFSYNAETGAVTRSLEGYDVARTAEGNEVPIRITTGRDGKITVNNGTDTAAVGTREDDGVSFTDARGDRITIHDNGDRTTSVMNHEGVCEATKLEGMGPDGKPFVKELEVVGFPGDLDGKNMDGRWVREGGPESRTWKRVDDLGNTTSETFTGSFEMAGNGRITVTNDTAHTRHSFGKDGSTQEEQLDETNKTMTHSLETATDGSTIERTRVDDKTQNILVTDATGNKSKLTQVDGANGPFISRYETKDGTYVRGGGENSNSWLFTNRRGETTQFKGDVRISADGREITVIDRTNNQERIAFSNGSTSTILKGTETSLGRDGQSLESDASTEYSVVRDADGTVSVFDDSSGRSYSTRDKNLTVDKTTGVISFTNGENQKVTINPDGSRVVADNNGTGPRVEMDAGGRMLARYNA